MSVDSLLEEVAERGFLFSNLFQLGPDLWQCNLRIGDSVYDFGRGATAACAIEDAIENLSKAPSKLHAQPPPRVKTEPNRSILADLGLSPPIIRRLR